jgi:uncharacterized protein
MRSVPLTLLFSFLIVLVLGSFVCSIPAEIARADEIKSVRGQVISEDWRDEIEYYLLDVDKNTTAEIIIYVIDSLYGHGIEKDGNEINDITQLGVYIFNELHLDTPSGAVVGIGKADKDNGVLVLVAMQERQWRIEVGYGLEGNITDVEANNIAQENLVPKFQEGQYGEGLVDTVIELAKEIPLVDSSERMPTRGRYVYDSGQLPSAEEEIPDWVIILIVIFVIVLISIGGRFGGRRGRVGRWGGGGGGGHSGGGGGGGSSGGGGAGGGW